MTARLVRLGDFCYQDRITVRPGERQDLRYIGLETIESGTGQFQDGEFSKTPDVPQANSFHFGPEHVLYGKLRPYLNKVALPEFEGKCSTEIIPLRPSAALDRRYLAYFLRGANTVARISERTAGARMPRADMEFVLGLQLPLPSIDEQRRIIDLLSRAEGIVRLRREAQKKAAEIIPALFLDMFGDPASNPRAWPVVELGNLLAEPPVLGTMTKPSSAEGKWLDLRVANIQEGALTLADKKWVDLADEQVSRFELRKDDLLLARAIGSLDHLGKAIIVEPMGNWTFDSHLMRVRLDQKKLLAITFKAFLESPGGREAFLKHTRRSAVQFNINGKELRRIRIPLPPIAMQNAFADRALSLRSLREQQQVATQRADSIFSALLARVFLEQVNVGAEAIKEVETA